MPKGICQRFLRFETIGLCDIVEDELAAERSAKAAALAAESGIVQIFLNEETIECCGKFGLIDIKAVFDFVVENISRVFDDFWNFHVISCCEPLDLESDEHHLRKINAGVLSSSQQNIHSRRAFARFMDGEAIHCCSVDEGTGRHAYYYDVLAETRAEQPLDVYSLGEKYSSPEKLEYANFSTGSFSPSRTELIIQENPLRVEKPNLEGTCSEVSLRIGSPVKSSSMEQLHDDDCQQTRHPEVEVEVEVEVVKSSEKEKTYTLCPYFSPQDEDVEAELLDFTTSTDSTTYTPAPADSPVNVPSTPVDSFVNLPSIPIDSSVNLP